MINLSGALRRAFVSLSNEAIFASAYRRAFRSVFGRVPTSFEVDAARAELRGERPVTSSEGEGFQ